MGYRKREREREIEGGMVCGFGGFDLLPTDCIAKVLSLSSPRETCRLSLVSPAFLSAAQSDGVWERFLPPDYEDVMGRAVDGVDLHCSSKKDLYLRLCDRPLIIDGATKSFWLEKGSGKKCYMLAARQLVIVWGDTPQYWRWTSLPESRFVEVAELLAVCWLEIRGKIDTRMLSPDTTYAAYLVFNSTAEAYGFENQPVDSWVGLSGGEGVTRTVYLDPSGEQRHQFQIVPMRLSMFHRGLARVVKHQVATPRESSNRRYPKPRQDGWLEVELGEYVKKNGEDGELEISLMEVKGGAWKSGLIIQGIEVRPKEEGK